MTCVVDHTHTWGDGMSGDEETGVYVDVRVLLYIFPGRPCRQVCFLA